MRLSNKRRGVFGQLITLAVLALTLTFLVSVSPISGSKISGKCAGGACGCDDKCGKIMKANVVKTTEGKDFLINSHCTKDCKKGAKNELWAHKTRVCESGQYYQNCQDMEYCSQNNKCEKVGNTIKWGSTYRTCSAWKIQYYFNKKA
jgi:hypothetical protein